jgi:exosome complex component RRP42
MKKIKTNKINIERIKKYLEEGKRFDGRKIDEFREIEVETNISKNAEGSVRIKLGKTEVLVGIKTGIMTPYPDSPTKGSLMVSAELSPLASVNFENGPPEFNSIELGRVLDRALRESGFIDFEKLCIKEGEKAWNIFVDVYAINDDGNLLDAAGIGAIIALKNSKMPKYLEKEDKIDYTERTEKIPLTDILPISITVRKIGDNFIVDPTIEEEDSSEARVTVGISDGIVSSMQKGDVEIFSIKEMEKALDIVEKVSKDLTKKIKKYIK